MTSTPDGPAVLAPYKTATPEGLYEIAAKLGRNAAEQGRLARALSWLDDIAEDEPQGAYEGHTHEEVSNARALLRYLTHLSDQAPGEQAQDESGQDETAVGGPQAVTAAADATAQH